MERVYYKKTALGLRLICVYLLCTLLIFLTSSFKVQADVAVLQPILVQEGGESSETFEAEAGEITEYELRLGTFVGSVPEEVTVDSIFFRLGWSRTPVSETLEQQSSSTGEQSSSVVEVAVPEVYVASTSQLEVSTDTLPSVIETQEVVALPSVEFTEQENVVLEVPPEQGVSGEYSEIEPIDSEQEEYELSDDVVSSEVHEIELDEQEASPVNQTVTVEATALRLILKGEMWSFVSAQLVESAVASVENVIETVVDYFDILPPQDIEIVSVLDEDSSTAELVVKEPAELSYQILYSIDGLLWQNLGWVDVTSSGEAVFDLSELAAEDIDELQIVVRYKISQNAAVTKVDFHTTLLEVNYTELLLEDLVPEEVVSDQEPNFKVSAIRADVSSENIRAVIVERGGVLEFWYSVTDLSSREVFWGRLAGGSAIDVTAPIAIKERTVFWLDQNQQTLFGFSVDSESIFGVPFVNTEDRIFLLPFTDDDYDRWEVVFDPAFNTLTFNRVRNHSS